MSQINTPTLLTVTPHLYLGYKVQLLYLGVFFLPRRLGEESIIQVTK